MSIKNQAKLAGVALAAAVAFSAFGAGEAQAAFNVKAFRCTEPAPSVFVDVSGLGGTNLCIQGSVVLDLSCACANKGGNCPNDANKQTTSAESTASVAVEPKNGRVRTEFQLPIDVGDGLCSGDPANLGCPGGQNAKLIKFESDGATFTICTTAEAAGRPCSCDGAPSVGDLPQTRTCPPFDTILFPGDNNDCLNLFP